ncbi:MAG: hypothetical protein FWG83_00110 [Oscillospiraceae bacterium]|nr:hypothetical protein [Oscillospiraceae bacterium]
MNENKKLHGNHARIDPKKHVTPVFQSLILNDYRDERYGNGRSYHRLDDDADFAKQEVDDNEL